MSLIKELSNCKILLCSLGANLLLPISPKILIGLILICPLYITTYKKNISSNFVVFKNVSTEIRNIMYPFRDQKLI